MASTAFTLDMLMIEPPLPCFTIWRAAAWPARKTPFRFTESTRSKSFSSRSRNSAACTMPALATRTSRLPNSSTAERIALSTWSLRATSQATKLAEKFSERSFSTSRRPMSSLRSVSNTFAPSRANACAHARPIPCAAPVTRATLPESLMRLFRRSRGNRRDRRHRRQVQRLRGFGCRRECLAHRVLPLRAALRRARADHGEIVLCGRAPEVRLDEGFVIGVLHAFGEDVHVLPVDHDAQHRVGERIGDLARVALAPVLPRLVEPLPRENQVHRLLRLLHVGRGAGLLRLRGEDAAGGGQDGESFHHVYAAFPGRRPACDMRSRIARTMPWKSRPQSARSSCASPCSTKASGSPRCSSGTDMPSAASASATPAPAPPATTFSSMVTTRSCVVARR